MAPAHGDELNTLCELINEATKPLRMHAANGDEQPSEPPTEEEVREAG